MSFSIARLIPLAVLLLTTGGARAASVIEVTPLAPTIRARAEGVLPEASPAALHAARNEAESLQFALTARGGPLSRVDASISSFTRSDGTALPPGSATLYREALVSLRHSSPGALEAPGLIPDPLTPLVNPYSGEKIKPPYWNGEKLEGASQGGAPFEIWEGRHEMLWLDVQVPADAAPGEYTATLHITADHAVAADETVTLTIWDFTLPSGPTHENSFGGFGALAAYHHMDSNSEAFYELEERYSAALAAHRINPELPPHLLPTPGEDGAPSFTDAVDEAISSFIARHHVTNIHLPSAPFGDVLAANREKALRFYRGWYDYLARKGWADRAYLYMLDEPNEREAYEQVRGLGALVHEAQPGIRRLVVEQTYTQDPTFPSLDDSVDIWCPLFGFVDEGSTKSRQSRGNHVWSYTALTQTAPPYHPDFEKVKNDHPPFWEIDAPVTAYRIAPWLNRRYGITGLLYWSVVYFGSPDRNPWQDPGFRVRWNGEGALFYPGTDAGIEGPIASIRLKNLRDGMEDYEYFALLESLGGAEAVEAIVREAVPTWGSWKSDPAVLPALRERLAAEILSRKK